MMLHNPYSNHFQQIEKPTVPFNYDIPNGLVRGKQIFIKGGLTGDQVKIDLKTRTGSIALHINPRLNQGCIVRNSNLGAWGAEEKAGPMPFKKGKEFEIIILVEEDKYMVAIDGKHAFEFRHRCPYSEVTNISISGDAKLGKIIFSGGASSNSNETNTPKVPFSIPVVGGPNPGRLIQIHGQVPPTSNRWYINLQNGPGSLPGDIAFHFNPRYDAGAPFVVRNNRSGGGWGAEERDTSCPIIKGQNFEILILIEAQEFKVAVNGKHYASFRLRNNLSEANHLAIEGDVIITSVRQF